MPVDSERGSFVRFQTAQVPTFIEIGPHMRARIETAIDGLIGLLDQLDGDSSELEDDSDSEPSLGWSISGAGDRDHRASSLDLEDDSDFEPSLGWSVTGATSENDNHPSTVDLEDEHDGIEPDDDFENADDNGIADAGGLAEQVGNFSWGGAVL
ncbi:hypothetical protein [Microvirga antarctica]|uniref:hypothetical protein n=1 Tax=Microvirga antarctica TaxID=2819233 RepID=UPI001FE584C2|nr:hypothetical protein [Microvirga antarctica]